MDASGSWSPWPSSCAGVFLRCGFCLLIAVVLYHLSLGKSVAAADLPGLPSDQRHLRIQLRPSAFAQLARQVSAAGEAQQREFAGIALDILLNAFQREVQVAQQERPRESEERQKLASWRRGTQAMVWRLQALRADLDAGGSLAIHVDSRFQVMILVNGDAVLVSGPRIEIEPEIERHVVERYCEANDCSVLEAGGQAAGSEMVPPGGRAALWVFQQDGGPSYQIGDWVQCRFGSLAQRDAKEAVCRRLLDELLLFDSALRQANAQGHRVEWDRLAGSLPAEQGESQVVLNADGAFVRLPLPLMARMGREDWQRAIAWLRRGSFPAGEPLLIQAADRLLGEGSSETAAPSTPSH